MIKKQLIKIVNLAVKSSFKEDKILESQVVRVIKTFKQLKTSDAVFAMTEYMKGVKKQLREHTLTIETAVPLSQTEVGKIKKSMEKEDFKISQIQVNINPEILGGVRVRIGDTIFDSSLEGKIKKIGEIING